MAFVFLPLAYGYLLSYVFRTINGPLADQLIRRFSLGAGSLGLLTSVYFLAFALMAIPIGIALDAFGPRLVQGCLMGVATLGAVIFATAAAAPALVIGRALIGVGVAGGLMAGLKAHALWVPQRLLPLANGGLMMFGGLGAIVATLPMEAVDRLVGWRGTFFVLAVMSLAASVTAFVLVPRHNTETNKPRLGLQALNGFLSTITDGRFLRIAPLSASVVGTGFAVHGLWAARWLSEVNHFTPLEVLDGLLAMGAGLTVGSLGIGAAAIWLAGIGVSGTKAFGGFCAASMVLQAAILLDVPVPPKILWGAVGAFGGMGVLSYSILDGMFPTSVVGRANSALNVLHLTAAWLVQAGMGLVINQWATDRHGHYPVAAYRAAFAVPLIVQVGAMVWYVTAIWLGQTGQFAPSTEQATVEAE